MSNGQLMFIPVPVQQKPSEEPSKSSVGAPAAVSLTSATTNPPTISKPGTQSVTMTAFENSFGLIDKQKQTELNFAPHARLDSEDESRRKMEECLLGEITKIEQKLESEGTYFHTVYSMCVIPCGQDCINTLYL